MEKHFSEIDLSVDAKDAFGADYFRISGEPRRKPATKWVRWAEKDASGHYKPVVFRLTGELFRVYKHRQAGTGLYCTRYTLVFDGDGWHRQDTGEVCQACADGNDPALIGLGTIIVRSDDGDYAAPAAFTPSHLYGLRELAANPKWGNPLFYDIRSILPTGGQKGYTLIPEPPIRPLTDQERAMAADLDFNPQRAWNAMLEKQKANNPGNP